MNTVTASKAQEMLLDAAALVAGQKHDSGAAVTPYGHGSFGLFNIPGTQPRVFSFVAGMLPGLLDALPVVLNGTVERTFGGYQAGLYTAITGVTADGVTIANQPTAVCDPYPTHGDMKVATMFLPKGRNGRSIKPLDIVRAGHLFNYADPAYLQLQNPPAFGAESFIPQAGMASQYDVLTNELARRLYAAALNYRMQMARELWSGNPASTAASDKYKQFIGLNTIINTGQMRDAFSGGLVPRLDSDVKNFNFNLVGGAVSIYQTMDMMYDFLRWRARQEGLLPVEWVIVMRPELFREISRVIPTQQYNEIFAQVVNQTNGRAVVDVRDAFQQRLDMVNASRLPLGGQMIRVIQDDSLPEQTVRTTSRLVAGQYASDVYFVPMTVLGNIPVTYIEPILQDSLVVQQILATVNDTRTWTSDGGLFRMYQKATDNCISVSFEAEWAPVMHTPHLAGRILNVAYQPIQHFDSAYPTYPDGSADPYFLNGGSTNSAGEPLYNAFQSTPFTIRP